PHTNTQIGTTDDQDINSSDIEQTSNDKKRQNKNKRMIIETNLSIDRYRLTYKGDRENFDNFEYSSEDKDL
ncbi:unnamed protein product, partial [Rotaria sp. Silwood2]